MKLATLPVDVGNRVEVDPEGVTFYAGHVCCWAYNDERDHARFQALANELDRRPRQYGMERGSR